MTESIYQAPESKLEAGETNANKEFFIVSTKKLTILYFVTLGVYSFYWFYKNWKIVASNHNLSVWPVVRAIFPIFFIHSLFAFVEDNVERSYAVKWKGAGIATMYVVCSLSVFCLTQAANKSIGSPYTDVFSFLLIFGAWFPLYSAQQQINRCCGDPAGSVNNSMRGWNYVLLVMEGLYWIIVVLGYFLIATGYTVD